MNAIEIIEKYLKENGYDGLYRTGCGCMIGELFPCANYPDDCKAGYKVPCDCEDGCNWHMRGEK